MGGGYVGNAGVFLIHTVFGIYAMVVLLRFVLQCVRADYYNPVSQAVVKVTNPLVVPLRRVIPGLWGLDISSLIVLFAVKLVELLLIIAIVGASVRIPGLLLLVVVEILTLVYYMYMFTIIVQAVLSWVQPGTYNPVAALLYRINEPLLGPVRRLLPPISGLDLSPLLVLVLLQLASYLVLAPLRDLAAGLA